MALCEGFEFAWVQAGASADLIERQFALGYYLGSPLWLNRF